MIDTSKLLCIINSLQVTDDQKELQLEINNPALIDILDFMEIRFPSWKQELGSWAAEFILTHIRLYEDFYEPDFTHIKHRKCLKSIYEDLEVGYYTTLDLYSNVLLNLSSYNESII
jgi:hypothetical protein